MNDSPVKVNLDVKADLTKPVEDITAIAKDSHKGIGKLIYALFGPMIENRIGQARRIATQADKDCRDIIDGKKVFDTNTGKVIPISEVSSVDALCSELVRVDSDCKAKRLAAAIMNVVAEIKQIPPADISDEPLNQTFFNHWRAEAELIDEEDLRKFWAHLLVEETKKPNSISPRTLDIVKNLSRQEAKAFEKIIHGVINNNVIINYDGYPIWGNYKEILMLQDARLIGSQSTSITYTANAEDLQKNKIVLIPFIESNMVVAIKKEKITFHCHVLTLAGRELYHISKLSLTLEQIRKIVEEVTKQNQNAIASILPIKIISTKSDGNIEYQYFWTPYWTNHPTTSSTEKAKK